MTSHAEATPTHVIELPDGRVLAVDEVGDRDGFVVVLLTSAPGSRRFDPDPAATAAAGVRLVTVDLAGYGGSTPLPGYAVPSVAGHADDVAHALRWLGLEDSAVIGWSAGGRVALALGAAHPSLVAHVAVVGTPALHDAVPWVPPEQAEQLVQMRADPASGYRQLAEMLEPMSADADAGVGMITAGTADEAVLVDDAVRSRLVAMMREAFRQGGLGTAADIVAAEAVPWGFELSAVLPPVELLYGAADFIGPAHGQWYEAHLTNARLRTVDGAGHLLVVTEWRSILAAVLP